MTYSSFIINAYINEQRDAITRANAQDHTVIRITYAQEIRQPHKIKVTNNNKYKENLNGSELHKNVPNQNL
jgi:type IV secretory pathway VirD2 relaxase